MSAPVVAAAAVLLALGVAVAARYNVRRLGQARRALEGWASSNGYALLGARLCWAPTGPFSTAIATHQPVYRVTVRDGSGAVRRGWVRCEPFASRVEARLQDG